MKYLIYHSTYRCSFVHRISLVDCTALQQTEQISSIISNMSLQNQQSASDHWHWQLQTSTDIMLQQITQPATTIINTFITIIYYKLFQNF